METNPTPAPAAGIKYCSECGRPFHVEDLMRFGDRWVCAGCKPAFTQQLREGAAAPLAVRYGGFWIRFCAILLDAIILFMVSLAINGVLAIAFPGIRRGSPGAIGLVTAAAGLSFAINIALSLAYQVYFLTKSGATPGKMALGLKVITVEGVPITPGRAVARYFGHWLSSMTLTIGYIIAAFDSEKRALHDYICNTRVIKVN